MFCIEHYFAFYNKTFRILFIPRLVRPVTHTFRAETADVSWYVSRPHIIDRYRFFQPVVFNMQDVRKVYQFLFFGICAVGGPG